MRHKYKKKNFRMMYSHLCLNSRETVPLTHFLEQLEVDNILKTCSSRNLEEDGDVDPMTLSLGKLEGLSEL